MFSQSSRFAALLALCVVVLGAYVRIHDAGIGVLADAIAEAFHPCVVRSATRVIWLGVVAQVPRAGMKVDGGFQRCLTCSGAITRIDRA